MRTDADGWRSTVGLTDRAVAEMIRDDRIDLLVVLAARFDRNRALVACYRPAPVQIAMFDGATTGLRFMDYWITDPVLTPPDTTERFTERVARLPSLFCYTAPESAPPVSALPAETRGAVTFGAFGNPTKISPPTIALWAGVLRAVPGSRLLLKYHTRFADPALELRFRIAFGNHGIAPAQLVFRAGDDDRPTHLSAYDEIDIALDTMPFNGSTTTFEALWMGVPVIALAGDTMISRMSAGMLTAAGLGELIAASPESFVARAAELAHDRARLATLRAGLRDRVARSTLCDGPTYMRSLEDLWRTLWRAWCAETPPPPDVVR
jgi:predicted O-linked N-acetylglucosamine transferase (SPINDLY family)